MSTREAFHELIDSIQDNQLLSAYFEMIKSLNTPDSGKHWSTLTDEERDDLLQSDKESYLADQLVRHNVVMEKHTKWRKK